MTHLSYYAKIQKRISAKYIRSLISRKEKFKALAGSIIGSPLVLAFAFMGRILQNVSLQPVFIVMFIGILWYLFFMVGHRAISKEYFASLGAKEQRQRLLYDSVWGVGVTSVFAFYASIALNWGFIEIGISKGCVTTAISLAVIDAIIAIALVVRHRWVTKVFLVDGLKEHKTVGKVVKGVFGFFVIFGGVGGGIASMMNVTLSREEINALIPFELMLFNIFPITTFVMALLLAVIAMAHYRQWKELKGS